MTDPEESSYYEISLTNRQVLLTFVVLLALVTSAFFCGVMVGKRNAPEDGSKRTGEAQARDGALTRELTFLNQTPSPASGDTASAAAGSDSRPPRAAPATTLVERIQPETAAASSGIDDLDEAGESALVPPQRPRWPDLGTSGTPSAKNTAAVTPPATAPSNGAPASGLASSGGTPAVPGEFAVQLLSTSEANKAQGLLVKLRTRGLPAYLLTSAVPGKDSLYRVRVGNYATKAEAETVAAQLKQSEKLETWVTR